MARVILLTGGNLGDVKSRLQCAQQQINEQIGPVLRCSHRYESRPWGFDAETLFSNQVLEADTDLSPDELAEACEEAGIRTAPIGLKIDTLGVAVGGTLLEISSLKKQVKGGNGRTEVEFTDNWEEDASRRDLTINAVYADENGNVFDLSLIHI